jgi:hypothetical protein
VPIKSEFCSQAKTMTPSRSGMGREIVYGRTPEQVAEDIELANHVYHASCRR